MVWFLLSIFMSVGIASECLIYHVANTKLLDCVMEHGFIYDAQLSESHISGHTMVDTELIVSEILPIVDSSNKVKT